MQRGILTEDILLHEQSHEIATSHVLHHKEEVLVVLEREHEIDDPWVLRTRKDLLFCVDVYCSRSRVIVIVIVFVVLTLVGQSRYGYVVSSPRRHVHLRDT